MENIALIGIDLGKNSFHIHCQDRRGKAVYSKKFTRPKLIEFLVTCPATTIAMEVCGGSHFMARKLDEDEVGKRLLSIPCVGTLTASIISTEIGDGKQYASSRDFAAAIGLVPRQYSTDGRTTLLGISKRGNKKIRTLLVQCARVFLQKLEHQSGKLADWVRELLCRKNKLCRDLRSRKQAGQNSLGTDGTTGNLRSVAKTTFFKQSLIWFCEY